MTHTNGFQEDIGSIKDDIRQLHSDFSDLIKGLTHEGRKEWKVAHKAIEKGATEGMERVSNAVHEVAERSEDAFKAVQDGIGKRPLLSIAAALGVGYLLGKLLGRD